MPEHPEQSKRFGGKLRTLRQRRGLSQRELAEALGYISATGYISNFENGKRKPTLDFVLKVADFLWQSPAGIISHGCRHAQDSPDTTVLHFNPLDLAQMHCYTVRGVIRSP